MSEPEQPGPAESAVRAVGDASSAATFLGREITRGVPGRSRRCGRSTRRR